MDRTDEIHAIASVLVGEQANQELLRALCHAAEQELREKLRPSVTVESCRESFVCAAAFLAASHLSGARGLGLPGSFSVGSVSVSAAGGFGGAEALRTQAALLMRPYLRGDFSFVRVRG